ncbi:phosphotransferase [Pseudonocardia endophytica]|uniref:Phosphotransferase family enzyme n=1 Tax=Pseudonocardia endophytica TaxID=401976 RepID=A0A4R1HK11_PSEEN|nr:phosphotransferase [Pseudonocardia endophytica]TCK20845.1 phosphotransferase family enzyme [Pseudonocardia endophytica]
MPQEAWVSALARRERRTPRIVGREPLAGGYVSGSVERVDLDDGRSVVVKEASATEVAAMRAIAVVDGVDRPRMLAVSGRTIVLAHHDGPVAPADAPVPDEVWRTLALVHAHWRRNRPRGIPVVDVPWWRSLCEHVLVALRAAAGRDPGLAGAVTAVERWAEDPRIARALSALPRTVCHGDAHRGNVLLASDGPVLIDWGNARVAPGGLDTTVLTAPDPSGPADLPPDPVPAAYTGTLADRLGNPDPPELAEVEREWALVQAHVQYLGFAADHQSSERVKGMVDVAARALDRLGPALDALR